MVLVEFLYGACGISLWCLDITSHQYTHFFDTRNQGSNQGSNQVYNQAIYQGEFFFEKF